MAKKKEFDLKEMAKEYAEIVLQENVIAARKEELKAKIKEGMTAAGADRVETNQGTFSIFKTTRYEYSPEVKALQEYEKEKGIAKASVSETFKFTPVKIKS